MHDELPGVGAAVGHAGGVAPHLQKASLIDQLTFQGGFGQARMRTGDGGVDVIGNAAGDIQHRLGDERRVFWLGHRGFLGCRSILPDDRPGSFQKRAANTPAPESARARGPPAGNCAVLTLTVGRENRGDAEGSMPAMEYGGTKVAQDVFRDAR